jgi:hypothetical protein
VTRGLRAGVPWQQERRRAPDALPVSWLSTPASTMLKNGASPHPGAEQQQPGNQPVRRDAGPGELHGHGNERFEFGLAMLIDGLAKYVGK